MASLNKQSTLTFSGLAADCPFHAASASIHPEHCYAQVYIEVLNPFECRVVVLALGVSRTIWQSLLQKLSQGEHRIEFMWEFVAFRKICRWSVDIYIYIYRRLRYLYHRPVIYIWIDIYIYTYIYFFFLSPQIRTLTIGLLVIDWSDDYFFGKRHSLHAKRGTAWYNNINLINIIYN